MKNRKRALILVLVLIVLVIAAVVAAFYVRPSVILENNTGKPVYLFSSQSEESQALTLEEIERRHGTLTLAPGEHMKLPLAVTHLLSGKTIRLDSGWRVGQPDSDGKRFNQGFVTDRHQGYCVARISISENGFMLLEGSQSYCYKKWVPQWPEKH